MNTLVELSIYCSFGSLTNYHETRPDSVDTAEDSIKNRFHSEDYTYAGGDWQKISDIEGEAGWTESDAVGAEAGSGGVWTYTPPEEQTKAIQDLIDSGEYDETYDLNKDDVIDSSGLDVLNYGDYGINIHRSNPYTESYLVNKWSAGCQVFKKADDYKEFIELCQQSAAIYGNSFTYTLITEKELRNHLNS